MARRFEPRLTRALARAAALTTVALIHIPPAAGFGRTTFDRQCTARSSTTAGPVSWHIAEPGRALDEWCHAVGPPAASPPLRRDAAPLLDDLVVISWNMHLGGGRLTELVNALRAGHFSSGRPIDHFVLLLQEVFRRSDAVPIHVGPAHSARRIAVAVDAPDLAAQAAALGLAWFYVPSMRNGANEAEDRGNAIVTTEPLAALTAHELPYERQRRVAVSATIDVVTRDGRLPLSLTSVHLDTLSSPRTLWLFGNPRPRQLAPLLRTLDTQAQGQRRWAGAIIGGDFNLLHGGIEDDGFAVARAWSRGLVIEDAGPTHRLGRLDHIVGRVDAPWELRTRRANARFGSDHTPVVGRFVYVAGSR